MALILRLSLFPTCQVRVVRFYHSCSGSFSFTSSSSSSFSSTTSDVHFRPANSSPISSPTSVRSGHCWTSTAGFQSEWARLDLNRKVLSAVGTAGPQPGTFRAQWAPLDLNLGPSELSGHRWTSVARWNARIYARNTARIYARCVCQNICHIECYRECQNICEKECHIECQNICQIKHQNIYQIKCWKICQI